MTLTQWLEAHPAPVRDYKAKYQREKERMRRAAKKDLNHNDIADYLEKRGFSVLDLSRLGNGCPDMVVSYMKQDCRMFTALVEVKKPGGKLNRAQEEVRSRWQGAYVVAETGPQAYEDLCLAMLGIE